MRARIAHTGRLASLATLAALAMPLALMGQAKPQGRGAAAIIRSGNGRGAPACITCHGPRLQGFPALGAPRIAGQSAPYVVAQLAALAGGARSSLVMAPVAKALSTDERRALAEYLSGLPTEPGSTPDTVATHADSLTIHAGEVLASRGRWSEGVPACDRCHGPRGVGVGTAFPALAGQPARYLVNQLVAWRQGTRPPGPLGLMSTIARRLSRDDIAAVAAYYALESPAPATAQGGRP